MRVGVGLEKLAVVGREREEAALEFLHPARLVGASGLLRLRGGFPGKLRVLRRIGPGFAVGKRRLPRLDAHHERDGRRVCEGEFLAVAGHGAALRNQAHRAVVAALAVDIDVVASDEVIGMDEGRADERVAGAIHAQLAREPVRRTGELQRDDVVHAGDEQAPRELALGGPPLRPGFAGRVILDAGVVRDGTLGRLIDPENKAGVERIGPNESAVPALLLCLLEEERVAGRIAFLADDATHLGKDRAHVGHDFARAQRQPELAVIRDERVVSRIAREKCAHDPIAGCQRVLPLLRRRDAHGAVPRHERGGVGNGSDAHGAARGSLPERFRLRLGIAHAKTQVEEVDGGPLGSQC
jgi:hypothetical protein